MISNGVQNRQVRCSGFRSISEISQIIIMMKVRVPLSTPRRHSEEINYWLHAFFTCALDGNELSMHTPFCTLPRFKSSTVHPAIVNCVNRLHYSGYVSDICWGNHLCIIHKPDYKIWRWWEIKFVWLVGVIYTVDHETLALVRTVQGVWFPLMRI
jgi:hypothetical protein